MRCSRILWGSGFRTCQNLIQWKDGWHGRSTLLPWWPLLQTWTCPYVSLCSSTWDWWLGHLPRSHGMGEGGDWWIWPMGVIVKGIPRGCQGLFTPVSLGYPLSVFNKNSTLRTNSNKRRSTFKRQHWPYRVIYLNYTLPKLFEGLVLTRLTTHNESINTLTSNKLGNRPST